MPVSTILLVEDDNTLAYGIEYTLKNEGFNIVRAGSLEEAREAFEKVKFNLILLDVKLPDGSGYDFCRGIRCVSHVPVIFLTASDEEVNVVMGLDIGADDYITKPFRIRELLSRIRAVLRRAAVDYDSDTLCSGNIKVYTLDAKVRKNNEEVFLTASEYKLLLAFMKNSGHVLSRSSILEGLWDAGGEFVDDNTLSVYIRRIREKIEDNPAQPKLIVTVRGLGYRWNMDVRGDV
jgi:DNA-binding response OmpR family regulator